MKKQKSRSMRFETARMLQAKMQDWGDQIQEAVDSLDSFISVITLAGMACDEAEAIEIEFPGISGKNI